MTKVQEYTLNEILENIVLTEEHIKDYLKAPSAFCAECLFKHALLSAGLAKEGVGFFPGDAIWAEIAQWAEGMRKTINEINPENAKKWQEEGRVFRKKLMALYGSCKVCALKDSSSTQEDDTEFTLTHLGQV